MPVRRLFLVGSLIIYQCFRRGAYMCQIDNKYYQVCKPELDFIERIYLSSFSQLQLL